MKTLWKFVSNRSAKEKIIPSKKLFIHEKSNNKFSKTKKKQQFKVIRVALLLKHFYMFFLQKSNFFLLQFWF